MKPTKQDIDAYIERLHKALLASHEADMDVENALLKKQAAHKELSLVRDELHGLRMN